MLTVNGSASVTGAFYASSVTAVIATSSTMSSAMLTGTQANISVLTAASLSVTGPTSVSGVLTTSTVSSKACIVDLLISSTITAVNQINTGTVIGLLGAFGAFSVTGNLTTASVSALFISSTGPLRVTGLTSLSKIVPWTAVVFASGSSYYTSGQVCQYCVDELGYVRLRGLMIPNPTVGTVLFTLAAGARPPASVYVTIYTSAPSTTLSTGGVLIGNNGTFTQQ